MALFDICKRSLMKFGDGRYFDILVPFFVMKIFLHKPLKNEMEQFDFLSLTDDTHMPSSSFQNPFEIFPNSRKRPRYWPFL